MSPLQHVSGAAAILVLAMPIAVLAGQGSDDARGGQSKSAALATELTQLLDASMLTSIAAKNGDQYVAALYIPGSQLLVVSGKFTGQDRMGYLITQKEYRDAYLDLSGASDHTTRVLYSDLGANGLRFGRAKDQPFDMVNVGGKGMSFDRIVKNKDDDHDQDEYAKSFSTRDDHYAQLLQTLIAALKKPS